MAVTVYMYSRSFTEINLTKLVVTETLHHDWVKEAFQFLEEAL